ncbi:MAG: thioredoxin [Candidatus Cloacimonetes bacterium]|nr:thioredoxin [Candidatus Cloacimonadota bacterium]
MLNELTHDSFDDKIKQGIAVVDFWAPWCGPCKLLGPVIEEIAKEVDGVMIGKLNVDEYPELAGKYGVMSIPTLLYFKDGELKDSSIGVVSKNVIQKKIELLKT